ncbi:MAG: hypothetical protein ACEPOV_07985 [Hyphomicrobiales bacterium]
MKKKLLIRDLTLRDGQQSMFATRMRQEQVERVLPLYKKANFYAMEVWGGAVPDSVMRFLGEDPWYRLESIKKEIGDISHLTALSRGRNLFGYNPYPESVIKGFNFNAVKSGIGIMRIFDCLNDVDNMKSTIKYIKEAGGMADCAVCYTVDPVFPEGEGPEPIFTVDYFLDKAKEMEALGADMITLKDMAGLVAPANAGAIIKKLKQEIKVPIDFHTHCTPGYGLASYLMALVHGVDIVDTNMMNFAGGPAGPSFELIYFFATKLGYEVDIDLDAVYKINQKLKSIREELADFDTSKRFPIEFDIRKKKLPKDIEPLFDKAIKVAKKLEKKEDEGELLDIIHQIEKYFNFDAPNEAVKKAEIPGGMYTNMLAQLKQLRLDHLLGRVLEAVPKVRLDAGCPPLVTPSSQIVGSQAVNCVVDEVNKRPWYSNVSNQFHNLVKGQYGKTPIEIDPDFREKICGHRDAQDYDTSNYKKQDNPVVKEYGKKLAIDEKEELLLELFPAVAKGFLDSKRRQEREQEIIKLKAEKKVKRSQMKYTGKLKIRDLTLRDGQQSLFATRVPQEDIDKVLPFYKTANFYAMEVWGGAVPDSVMRYLNENPWDRLEKIKAEIGDVSKLTALSRGRNLFGYNPYPDSVIQGFNEQSVKSGIGIMRIFDCLNDVENMKSTIKCIKEAGGIADCAVCYTVDPKFTQKQRVRAFFKGQHLPKKIFTEDYFLGKAKEMEALGANMITIKDMAGLIPPSMSGRLVRRFKKELKVPIDFHTHCTPGYGLASVLMAIVNGVDVVDTNIMNFAGGAAAPAFEIIQIFADKLGLDTGVDLESVVNINKELHAIRERIAEFDSYKMFPIDFDITWQDLPAEIDALFDKAIQFAKADKEHELLNVAHQIEKYFNFPMGNEEVKKAEIPGGMYTNMLAQLKQLQLDHLLGRVLQLVPEVRVAAGCPPLVTPSSQIVGAQAVNCVVDMENGRPAYTNKTSQFINLVKGYYGKTPINIDPKFREQICGHTDEREYDTSNYKEQENPTFEEFGGVPLAKDNKEKLLLELFPAVAKNFLKGKIEAEYQAEQDRLAAEERRKHDEARERWLSLSPEEKEQRLQHGLKNYWDMLY